MASGFFIASRAPGLRLIQISDDAARFAHDWLVRIVCVAGAGSALAEAAEPLGMTDAAHDAIRNAFGE